MGQIVMSAASKRYRSNVFRWAFIENAAPQFAYAFSYGHLAVVAQAFSECNSLRVTHKRIFHTEPEKLFI